MDKGIIDKLTLFVSVLLALLAASALPLALARCSPRREPTVGGEAFSVFISREELSFVLKEKLLCKGVQGDVAYPSGVYADPLGRCVFIDVMGKKIHKRVLARALSLPCKDFFVELSGEGMLITEAR